MGTVIDSHFLGLTAIVTVGYHFLLFIVAALLKFDKVTDFAECTNFAIVAMLTLILKGTWKFRQIVLTSLVFIWGLCRGLFLLMRWKEYRCFDYLHSNLAKLAFWILQAFWVWTISLPVTVLNSISRNPSLQAMERIGWTMWSVGFLVEATSDLQRFAFKNSPENIGRWCNVGLWQYSRHPNFFGEILLWLGIFVASTPVLEGVEWLVIIGPIFLTFLHLFITSIPMLEKSENSLFWRTPEYWLYKRRTSPLILLPPAVYWNLPSWFKVTFLFEFPLYGGTFQQVDLHRVGPSREESSDALEMH